MAPEPASPCSPAGDAASPAGRQRGDPGPPDAPQPRREYLAHHLRPPGAQITAAVHARAALRRLAGERREVLVGPERLQLPETLYKVLRLLGVRAVAASTERTVTAVHWTLATHAPPSPVSGAVNGGCIDISKRRVEAASRATLGYDAGVDPEDHDGWCVRKGDANALHDGVLIRAPVRDPDPDAVYQRLVDTEAAPGVIEELRVPVIAGTLPGVYVKRRPAHDRFGHGPSTATPAAAQDVLDAGEVRAVLALCRAMALDFGELDVLRDRHDGRIYVVDVNRTPWGPPRTLGTRGALRALALLSEAFEAAFLARGALGDVLAAAA
jgi:hypothetical protein